RSVRPNPFIPRSHPMKHRHSHTPILHYSITVFAFALMLACASSSAAGISSIHSLEQGSVTLTNTQKRSSWVPVALLFRFDAPASGAITVERLVPCDSDLGSTGSTTFLLAECVLSNNLHAVW